MTLPANSCKGLLHNPALHCPHRPTRRIHYREFVFPSCTFHANELRHIHHYVLPNPTPVYGRDKKRKAN